MFGDLEKLEQGLKALIIALEENNRITQQLNTNISSTQYMIQSLDEKIGQILQTGIKINP